MTGRVGQKVVLELRRRLFAHFLRLGRVPRGLHLRAGDLPADLRHGGDLRPVRGGPRLAGRGRADAAAGRHRDAPARLAARPGGAGRLHPADVADRLVPARVRPRLPAYQGDHRTGHRAFRRDVRRDQGGAGVPPGEAELRDLLRPGPGLRRREHARVPARRHLRPVHLAGRQHHHRRRARLRRPARDRRKPQGRRAGDVPAVPAALLRSAAGRVAVLQHLPVGGLRPGEDLRRAGGGRRGARAAACPGRCRRQARRPAGAVRVGDVRLPGQPRAARAGPGHTGRADGRPGRRDRRGQDDDRAAARPVLRPPPGRVTLDGVDLRQLPDSCSGPRSS